MIDANGLPLSFRTTRRMLLHCQSNEQRATQTSIPSIPGMNMQSSNDERGAKKRAGDAEQHLNTPFPRSFFPVTYGEMINWGSKRKTNIPKQKAAKIQAGFTFNGMPLYKVNPFAIFETPQPEAQAAPSMAAHGFGGGSNIFGSSETASAPGVSKGKKLRLARRFV